MTNAPAPTRSVSNPAPRRAARRAATVAAAATAALALWAVVDPIAGVDLTVRRGTAIHAVGPGAVLAASVLAGLAGWALLAVFERTLKGPTRAWTVAALVALALSLSGPIDSAADAASMVTLAGMHLLVAAVLIPGLRRSAK